MDTMTNDVKILTLREEIGRLQAELRPGDPETEKQIKSKFREIAELEQQLDRVALGARAAEQKATVDASNALRAVRRDRKASLVARLGDAKMAAQRFQRDLDAAIKSETLLRVIGLDCAKLGAELEMQGRARENLTLDKVIARVVRHAFHRTLGREFVSADTLGRQIQELTREAQMGDVQSQNALAQLAEPIVAVIESIEPVIRNLNE